MEDTIKIDLNVCDIEYLQDLIKRDKRTKIDTYNKRYIDTQLDIIKQIIRKYEEREKCSHKIN